MERNEMKTIDRYNSDEILAADDLYDIQENVSSFGIPIEYEMTDGELGWLNFVRGKYAIADWVDDRLEENVLTFDDTFNEALYADNGNFPKATCLSDDTALQKLFFWCFNEIEAE
jgi:hypothetical protein